MCVCFPTCLRLRVKIVFFVLVWQAFGHINLLSICTVSQIHFENTNTFQKHKHMHVLHSNL